MTTLARFIVRRPRRVVVAWVLGLLIALIPAGVLQDRVANGGYDVAGSQSRAVSELAAAKFDHGNRQLLYVVLRGGSPQRRVVRANTLAKRLRTAPALASAGSLPPERGRGVTVVPISVPGDIADVQKRIPEMRTAVQRLDADARLLGEAAVWHESTKVSQEDLSRAETIALPITLVILVIAFLSVVAAGLPIVLALVSLLVTFAALSMLALVLDMSVYVTNTASTLGLGLAIDYSLFIVTRYRELRSRGTAMEAAISGTLTTTGRAILFSGVTVALALSSLAVIGVGVFASMALGASVAAAIAALGALTFVPAVLCMLGERIDRLQLRPAARAAESARLWRAVARTVLARPVTVVVVAITLLLLCALPLTKSHLTFAGSDILLPHGNELHVVNHAAERALGGGALSPVAIMTDTRPRETRRALLRVPGVAAASAPEAGADGWYRIIATPTMAANTPAADRLVRQIRAKLQAPTGGRLYVGGETAQGIDLIDRIKHRIAWMVAVACALSFLLLLIAFRSIVIPLKAVLTNLLSVAATLGLVSLIFEQLGNSDGIAWFVPPFLFAIVFGLSMDYEIFLLSRVRDEHLAGRSNEEAITQALIRNARPITLAALVMVTVFLAFALGRLETFRQLGIGMAIAVFLDATIVRCALVPSAIVLLGDRNWWLPRPLARLLPTSPRVESAVATATGGD